MNPQRTRTAPAEVPERAAAGASADAAANPKCGTTEAVRALVRTGRWSGNEVAAMLDMRRRTFNRRLRREGTTFRNALAKVRFETACELLRDPTREIPEVARLLGYSGASAFTRAFRHWSGTTPARWRSGR